MYGCFNTPLALLTAIAMLFICVGRSEAIPAFARLHKAECATCHTIYPELNEYGEAFLKNSYVYTRKAGKTRETPEKAVRIGAGGDPELAETLKAQAAINKRDNSEARNPEGTNEALWLSGIPELLPVSLTATLNAAYDQQARDNDKLDFATRALVLQAGGAFRDMAGFFASYNLYSQGTYDPATSNTPVNNSPNLNEMFLVWRHAFGSPVNVKIGRFRPKLSLWKTSNKISTASFATTAYRVGKSQFSLDATGDAAELNAVIGNRLFVAVGIVDRNGQNTKEGYGHISYKFGGADFLGEEPEIDLESDSIWDYLSVTLGGYGHAGRNATLVAGVADKSNNFYRAGVDLDILYKRFRTRLSGVYGKDTNPDFLAAATDERSLVMAAEAEYLIGSNVIALFRYEYQDDGNGITRRYIPAIAYAPIQNTRLELEYKYEGVSLHAAPEVINRIALLGVSFSF